MIWAIDQDTGQYDALAALLGEDALATALLEGGNLSDSQKETLADQSVNILMQNLTPDGD